MKKTTLDGFSQNTSTFDVLNNLGHRTLDCTEVPEVALARATGDSGGGDVSPSLISSMLLL